MDSIVLYADKGATKRSLHFTRCALKEIFPHRPIVELNAKEILEGSWTQTATLLVMPGGQDIPYHRKLQGPGTRMIREFVEGGGFYLGICAGAYFGSAHCEFEKGEELEVIGSRELVFFPGKAIGSAFEKGKFHYSREDDARIARIRDNQGSDWYAYFNGGCYFDKAESYPSVEVLGRYADIHGNPAAVVLCQVGKGKALLMGVHPEYSPEFPYDEEGLQPLLEELAPHEQNRKTQFKRMIALFNEDTNEK